MQTITASSSQIRLFHNSNSAEENPARAVLIEAANAVIGYLQDSRGYQVLRPFDCQTKSNIESIAELANAIMQQQPLYASTQASVGKFEAKQTSYEKCDLAFGFLLALPGLLKEFDNFSDEIDRLSSEIDKKKKQQQLAARVHAILITYLYKDAKIEAKKVERAANRGWLQSSRASDFNDYNSQENRKKHANILQTCFKECLEAHYVLEFAPVLNLNKSGAGSHNFMAVYKVLCECDPFAPVAYDIIKNLRATMQIDEKGQANCFNAIDYFNHFRRIYIEAAEQLLRNVKYQNPRAIKTILTNVFLLETKCYKDKMISEIPEVRFEAPTKLTQTAQPRYLISCYIPSRGPGEVELSEWLLNNVVGRGCTRKLDSLIPHDNPTVFEQFVLSSLKAIEMFEKAQASANPKHSI